VTRRLNRAAFRTVLYLGGGVATSAGLHTAIAGAKSVPGHGRHLASPCLESELRFYGAFYAAYGVFVLRVASRADRDNSGVRAVAGTLFAAGLARAGGWRAAGKPDRLQRALLAIELAAPPTIVAWHARLPSST
jgi:hypothetical protein